MWVLSIFAGTQRNSRNKYIKNYDFDYPQTNAHFTVTSVAGHVMEYDFNVMYSKCTSCDPFTLFDAPIECKVKNDAKTIADNLKAEARGAQMLMIWTDCDREGENIGVEIAKICERSNTRISVRRARFSAIIAQYVFLRTLFRLCVLTVLDKSIMPLNTPSISTWLRLMR